MKDDKNLENLPERTQHYPDGNRQTYPEDSLETLPKPKIEEWTRPEKLILLRNWAMWGCDDNTIAERVGVHKSTLDSWRKKSPAIDGALSNMRDAVDAFVEDALQQKALSGDTQAIRFWLEHRKPELWNETAVINREAVKLDNKLKKLRIKELETEQMKHDPRAYKGIPADAIAPPFIMLHHDIAQRNHSEYILPGGRGSTKSSFVSLEVINLLERNPDSHAVVLRMVADTMRNSVFNQIQWALEMLGLEKEYKTTFTPLEITKKTTGQKIYFRGADDPSKIKSIAMPFGHVGVVWFEEFDQFKGSEPVRKIEQSLVRGHDDILVFKSFNPPRSKNNFANEYVRDKKERDTENTLVVESTYLDVPESWLGKGFIQQAEFLKETNYHAYENEYLGVANGSGGNVFENVVGREVTDEEIETFDNIVTGVDWGWYPDPYHMVKCQYNKAQSQLIIFDELCVNKVKNEETARLLKEEHGIRPNDVVVCDSAEPKSIAEYINHGIKAVGARKGVDSVDYGIKWLASLREIVIDPKRCPKAFEEFIDYEYDRDDNGEILSGYLDENNHSIDATRYATEKFSRRESRITVG